MMKKIFCFVMIFFIVMNNAQIAECLLAQESTQDSILEAAKNEVDNLKEMIANQKNMLENLNAKDINDINNMRSTLMNNFKNARDILSASGLLTHLTNDIENQIKSRHPDWQENMTIDELKARNEARNTGWKNTMNAYLRSINMTANDFDNDEKLREKIMTLIKNPAGQTQAIQCLGAILDHSNLMLARNENTIQGIMTAFIENERDNLDSREQKGKSIIEVCESMSRVTTRAKTRKLGL